MQLNETVSRETVAAKNPGPQTAVVNETDANLVRRVIDGENKVFEVIMRRYNQRLYRVARGIVKDESEAMDVVQDAYVKIYYQLGTFRGPNGFASWLSRIVSNEALMHLRKLRRSSYTLDESGFDEPYDPVVDAQPLSSVATGQLRVVLEAAIDQLPLGIRCVYMMRAVQQLSTRETALSLDISEELVKTRYLRAKRLLQKIIARHIERAGLSLHEFDGARCNFIVHRVMSTLMGPR